MPYLPQPCDRPSTSSSSNSNLQYTPSCTTTDHVMQSTPFSQTLHEAIAKLRIGEVPEPGQMYMIRDLVSKKSVSLINGKFALLHNHFGLGGWHWLCDELGGGWIGFRNAVSGDYLGKSDLDTYFSARTSRKNKQFVLRPSALGGYNLCLNHDGLLKAAFIENNDELGRLGAVVAPKEPARWEFIKLIKVSGQWC
ncbi:hypothetical protein F4678DRAFT_479909 [Xylaria arbuscula]|nr:hypothetical protein F4678DRAFT_479909 [Xylaria arbuscula]